MDERARRRIATWPMSRDPLARSASLLDMGATMDFIARRKESGRRITVTAVALRAASLALRAVPRANTRIFLGRMEQRTDNLVSFVVKLDDGTLALGNLSNGDAGTLEDTAQGILDAAADTRGTRQVPLLPSFVPSPLVRRVTNSVIALRNSRGSQMKGAAGITMVPPDGRMDHRNWVSPPFVPHTHVTVGIALGPLHDAVVARNGEPTVTKGLWAGFTFDHRVFDGSERVPFQTTFCDAMEQAERFSGLGDPTPTS